MIIIKDLNLSNKLAVGVALAFSSEVLHLYEAKYPVDMRPRGGINSAVIWLNDLRIKADHRAVYSVAGSIRTACGAAYHAANSAYYTAYAANSANADNASATSDAAYAAAYAANFINGNQGSASAGIYRERYIHDRIVKILPLILEYKIENKQSFGNAEKVFEYLSDEDKVSFLFNLDILR